MKDLDQFFKDENSQFEIALKQIIEKKKELVFSITDMLRGKCLFESVEDINECAT